MPHQDGFGDNGPEATGLSKPDDGDDCMQKKSENVAHAPDGIKLKNLKNSLRLRNSPTTGETIQTRNAITRFYELSHAI
jgi:hypothetical protein